MHGLERMSELMPECGAILEKAQKEVVRANILFHVDLFNVSQGRRLGLEKHWQIPATANLSPFFLTNKKKSKKTLLFLLFAFICNVSLNMSKQIETQARHSQFFCCCPRHNFLYHTFYSYLPNNHKASTGCVLYWQLFTFTAPTSPLLCVTWQSVPPNQRLQNANESVPHPRWGPVLSLDRHGGSGDGWYLRHRRI